MCRAVPEPAQAPVLAVLRHHLGRHQFAGTVHPVPVVLRACDNGAECVGDDLPGGRDSIDGQSQPGLCECDQPDRLHHCRVVKPVAAHGRIHVVEPGVEPGRLTSDQAADPAGTNRHTPVTGPVPQAAGHRVNTFQRAVPVPERSPGSRQVPLPELAEHERVNDQYRGWIVSTLIPGDRRGKYAVSDDRAKTQMVLPAAGLYIVSVQ